MLQIDRLSVSAGKLPILRGLSLTLAEGECVGLTGRSGAGKTTLIKAVMGFLNRDCAVTGGDIRLDENSLLSLSPSRRRALCGKVFGYIPQNPMTAFDPRLTVEKHMTEVFRVRNGLAARESHDLAVETLRLVNLEDTQRVLAATPGRLSGGMLQRIAIAILLGLRPAYILADEPTSALDEENRALVLELMGRHLGNAGVLMISHDVEAMKELCGHVLVLDEGQIVEDGAMETLLTQPKQAWTRAFAESCARLGGKEWIWTSLSSTT